MATWDWRWLWLCQARSTECHLAEWMTLWYVADCISRVRQSCWVVSRVSSAPHYIAKINYMPTIIQHPANTNTHKSESRIKPAPTPTNNAAPSKAKGKEVSRRGALTFKLLALLDIWSTYYKRKTKASILLLGTYPTVLHTFNRGMQEITQ